MRKEVDGHLVELLKMECISFIGYGNVRGVKVKVCYGIGSNQNSNII